MKAARSGTTWNASLDSTNEVVHPLPGNDRRLDAFGRDRRDLPGDFHSVRIPPPPRGLLIAVEAAALVMLVYTLCSCASPHRFDGLDLQQARARQQACLDRGGPPPECRP